jgi:hypothetical protein
VKKAHQSWIFGDIFETNGGTLNTVEITAETNTAPKARSSTYSVDNIQDLLFFAGDFSNMFNMLCYSFNSGLSFFSNKERGKVDLLYKRSKSLQKYK